MSHGREIVQDGQLVVERRVAHTTLVFVIGGLPQTKTKPTPATETDFVETPPGSE